MNTKEQTIQECIQELQEDISEKEKLIEYLYQFDTYAEEGLTEEEYHKLCLTGLRYSDLLGQILMQTMPFLIYKGRTPNCFVFEVEDYPQIIKVCVPSNLNKEVIAYVDEYFYDDEKTTVCLMQKHLLTRSIYEHDIRTGEAFLNADNFMQRAKLLFPQAPAGAAFIRYAMTNPSKKYKESIPKKLSETRKKQETLANEIDKLIRETGEKRKKQQKVLLYYAQKLLKWTNKITVYDKSDRIRATISAQDGKIVIKEKE